MALQTANAAARQLASTGRGLHTLWGVLQQSLPVKDAGSSSSSSEPPQQSSFSSLLQQLSAGSWSDRLSALSSISISLQGHCSQMAAGYGPSAAWASSAALSSSSMMPLAAAAAAAHTPACTASAASAAAVPSGAPLSLFQGLRYRGDSFLPSNQYWLKQLDMHNNKVTAFLVAANVASYGMQVVSPTFTSMCMRVGYKIAAGEYWRLLTAAFVHGGILHVGVNMFALWNFGRMLEPRLGSSTFLTIYLGSALSGNTLGYLMTNSLATSLGSSSAIFGLMGAYLVTCYINRKYVHPDEMKSILQTLGLNLVIMAAFGGMMDNWAHFGGFAGGAAIAAVLRPRYFF